MPARLGNAETGELYVADTENSRVWISGYGEEVDGIFSIPKIGIPKEFVKLGQTILVKKNASGQYRYAGIDTDTGEVYNEGDADALDQTVVSQSQFDFASLQPYQGLTATVKGFVYGDYVIEDTQTADFSASPLDTSSVAINVPSTANRAIGVLVQVDPETGTLSYKQSSEFSSAISLPTAFIQGLLPIRDDGLFRMGYIKLANGITQLDNGSVWTCAEFFPAFNQIESLLNSILSTGLRSGGTLSIGTNTSRVDIAAGDGQIVDNYTDPAATVKNIVEWSLQDEVIVPTIGSSQVSFIGIALVNTIGASQTAITGTVNGVSQTIYIIFKTTEFTNSELRDVITLGRLVHPNLSTINAAVQLPVLIYDPHLTTVDGLRSIGAINVEGNVYSGIAAGLTIAKSAGKTFRIGSNYLNTSATRKSPNVTTDPATSPTTIFHRYRNGSGGWSEDAATTSVLVKYDDNSGTPANIPAGQFTIQRVGFFNNSQRHVIQLGQNTYNKISDAKAAIATESFSNDPNLGDLTLRAFLIIGQGTTDITDTAKVLFVPADNFGKNPVGGAISGTTTLQQAYNNSTSPEITTNSTLGALTVKEGTGTATNKVLEIQNNSSTVTNAFDGNGAQNLLKLIASTELTISSGAITVTQGSHRIDTEANAASDDLDTINGGTEGQVLFIRPENTARTVVVRHNGGGTGNIRTFAASDITLDETYKFLILQYDSTLGFWVVVGGGGSGSGAPTDATYITQTSNGTLSNEQALASLSTGFMKSATGTGVVSTQAQISLNTDVTGTLPAANGGTGANNAGDAFNNLSPLTTKGDLIGRNSSVAARVPVGADGTVLVADSSDTEGLAYKGSLVAIVGPTQLGSAQTTITFSSIPAHYQDLIVVVKARFTGAGNQINVTLNADTGASYSSNRTTHDNAATATNTGVNNAANIACTLTASSSAATAGYFGHLEFVIESYAESAISRTGHWEGCSFATATNFARSTGKWAWENVSNAVTSIELNASAGDFATDTVYALYGRGTAT